MNLVRTIIIVLLLSVVTACGTTPVQVEPAEAVLQKAVAAMPQWANQGYAVQLEFATTNAGTELQVTVQGNGSMSADTDALSFNGNLVAKGVLQGVPFLAAGNIDIIQQAERTYFRVPNLQLEPEQLAEVLAENNAQEWKLLTASGANSTSNTVTHLVSPNAFTFLRVLNQDAAYDARKKQYSYEVTVDQENIEEYLQMLPSNFTQSLNGLDIKNLFETNDFSGTIQIDAQTYRVHSLQWNMYSKANDSPFTSLTVTIQFNDSFAIIVPPTLPL
jgi:hypothetical protein